jgi:NDP-sugar pyrophosphorylase family protein
MLNIVIPMAGNGSRTFDTHKVPKPFIPVHNHPLIAWAIAGLPLSIAHSITFIARPEIANEYKIIDLIRPYLPENISKKLCVLNSPTSGQAETVARGVSDLPLSDSILIFNCDTIISNEFPEYPEVWDGLLGTFASDNPNLSFVESKEDKTVIRTAEKNVISNRASTGLYFFNKKIDFDNAYRKTSHEKESYVAPIFNWLISEGKKIGSFETEIFIPLGTSQEIEEFSKTDVQNDFMDTLLKSV